MRRKVLALLLSAGMVLGLGACSGSSGGDTAATDGGENGQAEAVDAGEGQGAADTEGSAGTAAGEDSSAAETASSGRPTDGNGLIGFSTMTLGAEFFADLDENVHARLEAAGYTVNTVSCEMNAATQVSDIENLITMDCEAIFFFAVDPDALTDVCKKGREAGIKMYGVACTMTDPDAYDKILNTDQYGAGVADAELAAAWIEETFPDAEDGSVDVAIIGNTNSVDGNNRTDGEKTISDICAKANVVEIYDLSGADNSNAKAQEYAEMMQSKYPDLKCVICYGCDDVMGTNEVYMRDANLNREEFAIFGVDTNEAVYNLIDQSRTNDSLVRGTVSLGDDLSIDIWDALIDADLEYMDENKNIFKPVKKITTENIDEYIP